jgi:hypothetical protein
MEGQKYYPGSTISHPEPFGSLKSIHATGASVFTSSPAVANGVVYVGSTDGNL